MYLQNYNQLGSRPPSLVASIYIVLSIALERFLAVCRPHQYREMQVNYNLRLLLQNTQWAADISIPITRNVFSKKAHALGPLRLFKLYEQSLNIEDQIF